MNILHLFSRLFSQLSVARSVSVAFALAIFIGSLILFFIEEGKIQYVDALYLSASAICVTGLSPLPISEMSVAAQFFLMILIQLGGLGIITFTVLVGMLIIKGLSRNSKVESFVHEALDSYEEEEKAHQSRSVGANRTDVIRVLISIFNIAITIELIGALILYFTLPESTGNSPRWFLSLFTSVSSFNNAGFSILDDLSFITTDILSLSIISILIILGGIGFPVIIFLEKLFLGILREIVIKFEIACETDLMARAIRGDDPSFLYVLITRVSVWVEDRLGTYNAQLKGGSSRIQINIIIWGSLLLIFFGGISIFLLEFNNPGTIGNLSITEKLANSFFISISSRTAGFNTFNLSNITSSTIILICMLMFIGGGPQGTAGGIKITTFYIIYRYLKNVINPAKPLEIHGVQISKNSVAISIRIFILAVTTLAILLFILTVFHKSNTDLVAIVFELISAFGTVGFSLGLTSHLAVSEKLIYTFVMYFGRIGVFTLLIAVTGTSGLPKMSGTDDGVKIQVG